MAKESADMKHANYIDSTALSQHPADTWFPTKIIEHVTTKKQPNNQSPTLQQGGEVHRCARLLLSTNDPGG